MALAHPVCVFCPQVFHCHFNSNFFPLFLDKLLGDVISPSTGAVLLGLSFVAPHINNLYFLSLCRNYGVYRVVNWLFYVKLTLSVVMLTFGPNFPLLICLFIARYDNMVNPRSLEGGQIDPLPSIFLALNFCSVTDCQKLWHNCSLFVNTSFDTN